MFRSPCLSAITLVLVTGAAAAETRRWSETYIDNRGHIFVNYRAASLPGGPEPGPVVRVPVPAAPNGCGRAFAIVSRRASGESGCVGRH